LGAPVAEWTVGGTALTSLMDVERRHGILLFFSIFWTVVFVLTMAHSFPGWNIQIKSWVKVFCIRTLGYGDLI
jgi:hypothetical protein